MAPDFVAADGDGDGDSDIIAVGVVVVVDGGGIVGVEHVDVVPIG